MENVLVGALGQLRGPRFGIRSYSKVLRRQALEHLDRVGLASQVFQRADTLSGGQMQRVAIARSLMQQPKILLADEPVASLDPESSVQVLELLTRIAREDKMTVVCSLHQVELAVGRTDRLVGLRDGRVVLDTLTTAETEPRVDHASISSHEPIGSGSNSSERIRMNKSGEALPLAPKIDVAYIIKIALVVTFVASFLWSWVKIDMSIFGFFSDFQNVINLLI